MERSQGERGRVRCLPGYHEQAGSASGRKTARKNVAKRRKYWGQKHLQQNSKKIRLQNGQKEQKEKGGKNTTSKLGDKNIYAKLAATRKQSTTANGTHKIINSTGKRQH